MRLRVAVVTAFPSDPADPCGGVETVSVALVRGLARLADVELQVVTIDEGVQRPTTADWDGVAVHRLPRLQRSTLLNAIGPGRRQVKAALLDLQPHVVHAHDVYGLMVKGLALPRVFTVHGFIHEDTRAAGGRLSWLRAHLWRLAETSGWADQPHIVSISPYVRERLSGRVEGRIHDIDNPISDRFFGVQRRDCGGVIYSGGALCARKNTLGLLRGFARLRARGVDAELRLSGSMPEPGYAEAVREFVHQSGLGDRVKLLGRLSYDAVLAELATASVFALLSFEENSPMSIEEAMAAGVPVVASNRCGMPYLVREGETGHLVDPRDLEDTAAALAHLLEDGECRGRMGEKAREIALDRFHPGSVARRTLAVYRRAAAGRLATRDQHA